MLHNNFLSIQLNLETIIREMNFLDQNVTNLLTNMELNTLEPLKIYGLVSSYKKLEGLEGMNYEIIRPKRKATVPINDDTTTEDAGIGKER